MSEVSSEIPMGGGEEGLLRDRLVVPHLASILGSIEKAKNPQEIVHVSNIIKQTHHKHHKQHSKTGEMLVPIRPIPTLRNNLYITKFSNEIQKLKWAGLSLPKEEIFLIEDHLRTVAEEKKAEELRFWGKILGSQRDYYVLQGVGGSEAGLEDVVKGGEKRGEGANYYTFWVSSNLLQKEWTELPLIEPNHIKIARKIKVSLSGNLSKEIKSYPSFPGQQKHYLKAQLIRMSSSLQIVPRGIYKVNDENPKIVEFEQQPKIPEVADFYSLESWVHRNQNLLNLGRCTHYIDPATPQEQLEALTAQLTEKDPEIERLRGISEDKLGEGNPFGIENIWQIRVVGDNQVFQKEEAASIYAVVVLKNLFWPGWVTVGYKGGFANYYTGYGHKWTQPWFSQYQNPNLGEEAQDTSDHPEPNPKEEPKPIPEAPVEPPPQEQ